MTTPIYKTASRLCLLLVFAAMALTSCDNATDTELSDIAFGTNNTDSVALNKQSTRIVLLHGGTGKYQANIADSKVASISISKDTLRINGLLEGPSASAPPKYAFIRATRASLLVLQAAATSLALP